MPRDEFKVTTKVGRTLHRPADPATFDRAPWTGGLNFEVHFDYSYDGVMRSYEQALQRLALDTVDALVIHDLDAMFHGDKPAEYRRQLTDGGGIRALQELKAAGDIKAFGMGINTDDALDNVAARARSRFPASSPCPTRCSTSGRCTTGWRAASKRGMSASSSARPLPRASSSRDRAPARLRLRQGLAGSAGQGAGDRGGVARRTASRLPAAALQFVLAHPAVVSVIPGAARAVEVTQQRRRARRGDPGGASGRTSRRRG